MKYVHMILTATLLTVSASGFAAEKLSDADLRQVVDVSTAHLHIDEMIQCPKNMEATRCEQLKTLRYASEGQTKNSYRLFLNEETQNPLSNQVIKQPLLTQPMQRQ